MNDVKTKSWYRPDIDGLRAVAVVAVILFHAKVPGFAGGFVGVDVFFVISGFLITSIIVRQLGQGTFSLLRFWERRIRRIVPALFVVLLSTVVAAYCLVLFPLDFLDFGQSLVAQALFLSNIFFLRKSDYFAGPSEDSPLLHTWSLAIEEQFYVFFPVLLIVLFWCGRRVVLWALGLLFVASLAYSQYLLVYGEAAFSLPFLPPLWAAADNAAAAFYLLPARAFELLVGALLAITAVKVARRSLASFAAGLGVSLVLCSVFLYDSATVFPGLAALLPTVGTALLIMAHTGHRTVVTSFLTRPTVVLVGLLSYSLYLWHWPVLVLGKYYLGTDTLDAVQVFALLTLTGLLSLATYYLVETPLRKLAPGAAAWRVYAAGLGALALLGGVGWYITAHNGLPDRASDAATQVARGATDFGPYWNPCFVHSFEFTADPCHFGPAESDATHIILGDSHGGAVLPGVAAAASSTGTAVDTYISAGCSPLHPVSFRDPASRCADVYQRALDRLQSDDVTDVLLVSRWTNYRTRNPGMTTAQAEQQFRQDVTETLDILSQTNARVTVLLQVPHHLYFDPRAAFYQAAATNQLPDYALPRTEHDQTQAFVNSVWQDVAAAGRVQLLDPTDALCDANTCDFVRDGALLYMDSNHLNATGATYLTPVFVPYLLGGVES